MSGELQVAIQNAADSDTILSDLVVQAGITGGRGIWFGEAPSACRPPWVTYYIISEVPNRVFRASDDGEDAIVQFSIFDSGDNPQKVWQIDQAIENLFDRKTLTYSTRKNIMCMKVSATGPTREEDGWMRTIDYRIIDQK